MVGDVNHITKHIPSVAPYFIAIHPPNIVRDITNQCTGHSKNIIYKDLCIMVFITREEGH